jgi:uncharacterized protein (TIGR00730 family)
MRSCSLNSLCVFCGSSPGRSPGYAAAARRLGSRLAGDGVTLVYGGGGVGLMGALADAVLDSGGQVTGVIPQALAQRELAHARVRDMRVVPDMHSRKALMADLADAFLALPGGFGTLDELLEVITWAQLGLHTKPIGLLDLDGYFAPLLRLIDHAVVEGFVAPDDRRLVLVDGDADRLVDALAHAAAVPRVAIEGLER